MPSSACLAPPRPLLSFPTRRSSDLLGGRSPPSAGVLARGDHDAELVGPVAGQGGEEVAGPQDEAAAAVLDVAHADDAHTRTSTPMRRSEERRVGKECRSRGAGDIVK